MSDDGTDRRWREIGGLFQRALDMEPEARDLSRRHLWGDREPRAEVEKLLRADDVSGDFLEARVEAACELALEKSSRRDVQRRAPKRKADSTEEERRRLRGKKWSGGGGIRGLGAVRRPNIQPRERSYIC